MKVHKVNNVLAAHGKKSSVSAARTAENPEEPMVGNGAIGSLFLARFSPLHCPALKVVATGEKEDAF
jgi:hypothetical protein